MAIKINKRDGLGSYSERNALLGLSSDIYNYEKHYMYMLFGVRYSALHSRKCQCKQTLAN